MNELGHLSGTTLSNAILDNTTDHTITKTKSCNVLYIFTTACLRVLPLSSTHRVDPLRLGKAERLSPFPRRKNEGKNAEPKDHNAKDCKAKEHKVSPKPNVEIGSVLGSYLIFGFCKKRVFLKRRKHNGSCWNVLRPVFSLRTRCAASIRLCQGGGPKRPALRI